MDRQTPVKTLPSLAISKNISAKCASLLTLGGLVIKFYLLKKTFHSTYILILVKPLPFTEMAELPEKMSKSFCTPTAVVFNFAVIDL